MKGFSVGTTGLYLQELPHYGRGRVSIYVEDKMVLKSNYYPKAQLARLATLSERLGKTEAALLREALADCLEKYRDSL
jgi:hypothetical protein